ncbi:glycosyltransferase family 4 protein [Fibrobacter sp. UWEL]|uniref:glycosyltransferase family 4 protein n=1 Tax=Fibrobacter sp. UWEL TaxID=1896209 RepID=UPI000916D441|nr:glycosyltransferase family 4 protein [Fibrobacter sp. UWEL]SHK92016.1 Glycosyltransferase involved in cell wall bisynthesis [Fibrobacter sp. UWEL]
MRILELSRWLIPGGAERFIVDLSNELAKIEGNEVCICTYVREDVKKAAFYKPEISPAVTYRNLNGNLGKFNQIINIFKVLFFIMKWKPDVVHCHLQAFNMSILPCLLFRKIKFVNTLHNVAEKNIKPGLEKKLKSFLYRHGMQAVTISPICYRSFSNYMGFNNTVMIDNGCRDIHKTEEFENVRNEIQSYKKTPNTKIFINVARFSPQKNHPLMIEAFNRLAAKGYDVALLVIGSYEDDPQVFENIKALIKTERIHLLGHKNNVPDYLYNSDAFTLSSKWEGAPISLLEAAFAGCYPVCTPAGGCVDDICSEEWGLLSEDFSIEKYEAALIKFLEKDNIKRDEISALYQGKFSMRACAQKYMDEFNKLG